MKTMKKVLITTLLGLALILTACGGAETTSSTAFKETTSASQQDGPDSPLPTDPSDSNDIDTNETIAAEWRDELNGYIEKGYLRGVNF